MAGSRVALLVATDVYSDNGLKRLRAPQRDATALTNVLADPEIGGFKVETMVNRPAQTLYGHTSQVIMLAISPDGKFLASVDANRIRIWRSRKSPETKVISNWAGGGGAIAFSPDGQLLAYGSAASTIRLMNPETGALVRTLFGHHRPVTGLAFSPDGSLLASASRDGTVRLWRVRA